MTRAAQRYVNKFPNMQNEHPASLLDYYTRHQASTQWRGFLTALAEEFESQLDTVQLRQLMARIGVKFAGSHSPGACATLDELASFFNATWSSLDWGFVNLVERDEYLAIEHYCAPLAAFGGNADAWTPAFLEGAYQHWLRELGAGALVLRQADSGDRRALEFRLAKTA
jgi:Cellulose synthase subunit D